MKEYTLFIFRRDLRVIDNRGFDYVQSKYENVIPIFIFTPEQITTKNKFISHHAIQFMVESLEDLDDTLREKGSTLHYFYGDNVEIVKQIKEKINVTHIVTNMDYTPYAKKRDRNIQTFCEKKQIQYELVEDYLLSPIGTFLKDDGDPYRVYSSFRDKVYSLDDNISKPITLYKNSKRLIHAKNIKSIKLKDVPFVKGLNHTIELERKGGRKNGLLIFSKLSRFNKYNKERNTMSIETTRLSAYIKFGCVSIREVYWKMKRVVGNNNGNELLNQLLWREFYYYIGHYFPEVLKGENFNKKMDYLNKRWFNDTNEFNKWKKGMTGYPIVDAAMRELNNTGYMHNRGRLISANFLNRILGQDWRRGEKYFANCLVDYDPLVNNGNWQWIGSTGIDTKPYQQRIFNPWIQSDKYDKDAAYIYKWIPELKGVPANHIHKWDKYCDDELYKDVEYPKPIVNYEERRNASLKMYKK